MKPVVIVHEYCYYHKGYLNENFNISTVINAWNLYEYCTYIYVTELRTLGRCYKY